MGLPRSGKSTICRDWSIGKVDFVDGLPDYCNGPYEQVFPRIIVEDDAIRKAITGDRFNFASESQVYAIKYSMIRTLMEQGYEVLVDDTHTSEPSIRRLLEININSDFCIVDTDPVECINRARATNQTDLVDVVHRHHWNLRNLIGIQPDVNFPSGALLAAYVAKAVRLIRGGVIERMEHTKRV